MRRHIGERIASSTLCRTSKWEKEQNTEWRKSIRKSIGKSIRKSIGEVSGKVYGQNIRKSIRTNMHPQIIMKGSGSWSTYYHQARICEICRSGGGDQYIGRLRMIRIQFFMILMTIIMNFWVVMLWLVVRGGGLNVWLSWRLGGRVFWMLNMRKRGKAQNVLLFSNSDVPSCSPPNWAGSPLSGWSGCDW